MTDDRELLGMGQVAKLVGLPYSRIHAMCLNEQIPYLRESDRPKARYLIRRRDAEALRATLRENLPQDQTSVDQSGRGGNG